MSDKTAIEWTDATWNPIRGCSKVSAGCENCYAMHVAARFSGAGQPYEGLAKRGPVNWTGEVRLVEKHLTDPLKWKKPRRIFVNSMSDLFHENVPDEWIDRIFAVMALCPQHTFQVLTKRPERALKYMESWPSGMGRGHHIALRIGNGQGPTIKLPLPNVWLGVSVENQATADKRIPLLLRTPAAVRFVSYEPALGPVDFSLGGLWCKECPRCVDGCPDPETNVIECRACDCTGKSDEPAIDWLIVGGESGPGARPCDVAWIRAVVKDCLTAQVPCFVKQLGARPFDSGADDDGPSWPAHLSYGSSGYCEPTLSDPKGGDPEEWPEDLRVREFPA